MLHSFQNGNKSKRRNCAGRMEAGKRENSTDYNRSIKRRKTITLAQKVDILNRKARGDKNCMISRDLDLHEATIRRIISRKDQIMEKCKAASGCLALQSHGRNRSLCMIRMEHLLSLWIEECNKKELVLRKQTVQAKALQLFSQVRKERNETKSKETFSASKGWYSGFMKRLKSQGVAKLREADSTNDAATEVPEGKAKTRKSGRIDDLEEILSMVEVLKQKIANADYDDVRCMKVIQEVDKAFLPYKRMRKEKKKIKVEQILPD
ncbi:hypothetical protein M513_06693 [Trichuris suis]|uniref:HTH CENPB-type domain-containing protein n=1 Tax=Trichuris suis TaxID=68888 RepID=A0A085M5K0_9BILA|nr:hypothetical protein M513_06693 [Trichuris suis]